MFECNASAELRVQLSTTPLAIILFCVLPTKPVHKPFTFMFRWTCEYESHSRKEIFIVFSCVDVAIANYIWKCNIIACSCIEWNCISFCLETRRWPSEKITLCYCLKRFICAKQCFICFAFVYLLSSRFSCKRSFVVAILSESIKLTDIQVFNSKNS